MLAPYVFLLQLFTDITVTHRCLFYAVAIIQYYQYYLVAPELATGSSFGWVPKFFQHASNLFLALLYFPTTQVVPASCISPAPTLGSALSPKSPGSFYWGWEKPGSGYWVGSFLLGRHFFQSFSADRARKHMHVHSPPATSVYFCIATHLLKSHVFTLTVVSNLLPCLVCIFSLRQGETWLSPSTMYSGIC